MSDNFIITKDQETKILEIYKSNRYIGQISKSIGIDRHAVTQVLRAHPETGYSPKTSRHHSYSYDRQFFYRIDNEEKAYFFGFLASDGSIKYANNFPAAVQLELHEKDVEILVKFREALGGEKPPKITHRKSEQKVRIVCHSSLMCNHLIARGFRKDKTYTLGNINDSVPSHLLRHFVRGVFDGDGHWSIEKYRIRWSLRGTDEFLESIQQILPAETHIYGKGWKALVTTKDSEAKKIGDWMYQDTKLFLKRKFDKYTSGCGR